MIFKQLTMAAICFQNEAKILPRHVFIAINISYEFHEDVFLKNDILRFI